MTGPTTVEPQPRIDTLVVDAVTGAQRRRTEYTGTAWYGTRPELGAFVLVRSGAARIESAFYLPDSLPYRAELAGSAVIAVSIAVQSAAQESHQFVDRWVTLEPDPRNAAVCWLQLRIVAASWTPVAIGYRIDVLVPPEAVLLSGAPTTG
jgi:hypothetical protein